MEIGTRVYYDKTTGTVVQVVGQRSGDVIETTQEEDFAAYTSLAERVPDTVGIAQFEYDQFKSDYEVGGVITRIDLESLEPLFTYPDPSDSEAQQEVRPALSTQVSALEAETAALNLAVIDLWETLANGGAT